MIEGLLEHEIATGGSEAVRAARGHGEAFLLERGLFRRRATGEPADPAFLAPLYPHRWRYDILRALDYFRAASRHSGMPPDLRLADAIAILRSRQDEQGVWKLEWQTPGRVWSHMDDGPGSPSPWITFKALMVLRRWDAHAAGA